MTSPHQWGNLLRKAEILPSASRSSACAAVCPEPPPRPGPGCVDAPICQSLFTAVRWLIQRRPLVSVSRAHASTRACRPAPQQSAERKEAAGAPDFRAEERADDVQVRAQPGEHADVRGTIGLGRELGNSLLRIAVRDTSRLVVANRMLAISLGNSHSLL